MNPGHRNINGKSRDTREHTPAFPGITIRSSQAIGQITPVREHITTINPGALLWLFDLTGLNEVL